MLGLSLYALLAFGFGTWLPPLKLGGKDSIGARIIAGYAAMTAAFFIVHIALQMSLSASLISLMGIAMSGILKQFWKVRKIDASHLFHPVSVFLLVGFGAIALNGGGGYLPFTIDEFTNWIGASRLIHLHGGYAEIADTIHLPGYTPGWRLVLLMPWQVFGVADLGASASAPFVMHLGLATLFYEIVRSEISGRYNFRDSEVSLLAWLALLLYLTAEGTGKLWTYDLLIEQPQIYAFTAVIFFLLIDDLETKPSNSAVMYAGLALMGGFLFKAAAIIFVPALGLVTIWYLVRSENRRRPDNWKTGASRLAYLILPTLSVFILWGILKPVTAQNCMSAPMSTLTPQAISSVAAQDWQGLARRYGLAVGGYLLGYKTLLAFTGFIGVVVAAKFRWVSAHIALAGFAFMYLAALYWYHLTCFGPYYFENLNSIPRLSRVVIQPFHAIGLLVMAVGIVRFTPKRLFSKLTTNKITSSACYIAVAALLSWQSIQIYRTTQDVTTRVYQHVDSRIAEMRALANFVKSTYPRSRNTPLVQIVNQGADSDVFGYAKFFSMSDEKGQPRPIIRYAGGVSWSAGAPTNHWQEQLDAKQLQAKFAAADIIWPITTDDWIAHILSRLVRDDSCLEKLPTYFLLKQTDGTFSCQKKKSIVSNE
ncbi:MAG: hypothetical protein HOH04_02180 [Rhodospirillaceae bacterium]|nr:hypothetical protein [Rhodospirillaceae bacterium]